MDEDASNLSSSYAPSDPNLNSPSRSSEGLDPPSRPTSGSWGVRSNSLPRSFPSDDTSTSSGKSGRAAWAKNLQSWTSISSSQSSGSGSKAGFNFFSNIGFNKQTTVKIPVVDDPLETSSAPTSPLLDNGPLNTIRTGFLTGSRNAVKAVQTKARHMVSQNKRRYQVKSSASLNLLLGRSCSCHRLSQVQSDGPIIRNVKCLRKPIE